MTGALGRATPLIVLSASILIFLSPLLVRAQTQTSDVANKMCVAGNYACDYGKPPPPGQSGVCMKNKPCEQKDVVKGVCEAANKCRGTQCFVNGKWDACKETSGVAPGTKSDPGTGASGVDTNAPSIPSGQLSPNAPNIGGLNDMGIACLSTPVALAS